MSTKGQVSPSRCRSTIYVSCAPISGKNLCWLVFLTATFWLGSAECTVRLVILHIADVRITDLALNNREGLAVWHERAEKVTPPVQRRDNPMTSCAQPTCGALLSQQTPVTTMVS
eukprot:scaffold189686_cov20-Tisochrysis_lutea.AAC.3